MQIVLPPELEALVQSQIANGKYQIALHESGILVRVESPEFARFVG